MSHVEEVGSRRSHVIPDTTGQFLVGTMQALRSVPELDPEGLKCSACLLCSDNLSQTTDLSVVKTTELLADLHDLLLVDKAAVGVSQNLVHHRVNEVRGGSSLHSDVLSRHSGHERARTGQSVNVSQSHEVRDLVSSREDVSDDGTGGSTFKLENSCEVIVSKSLENLGVI